MLTLNTNAYISPQNAFLTIPINTNIPEGEYEIVLVLQAKLPRKKRKITFSNHNIIIPQSETFRREDMYDENGR